MNSRAAASSATGEHARPVRAALTPRSSVNQHRNLRIAATLSRSNEVAHMRAGFEVWQGLVRERRLAVHLKRCSVALKHGNSRRLYTRIFLRWLAAAQQSAVEEARQSYSPPKDVPLRARRDVLALVRRYFASWRRHLRERRQRTAANVELLARVNEERARGRVFAVWLGFQQRRRDEVCKKRLLEVEEAMDELHAQRRARDEEVDVLRAAVAEATVALTSTGRRRVGGGSATNGSLGSVPTPGATPAAMPLPACSDESSGDSLARSKALAASLAGAVREAARQAAAAHSARTELAALRLFVSALADMTEAAAATPSQSPTNGGPESSRSPASPQLGNPGTPSPRGSAFVSSSLDGLPIKCTSTSPPPVRGCVRSPRRATGSPITPVTFSVTGADGTTSGSAGGQTPAVTSLAVARLNAEQAVRELAEAEAAATTDSSHYGGTTGATSSASQRLLEETGRLLLHASASKAGLASRGGEVRELQEVAARAVNVFGGRGGGERIAELPADTPEQSRQRSKAIVDALGELCEDMVVVLVLTSLWSQDGNGEKASDSLERMWRSLQHASEGAERAEVERDRLKAVVEGAVELLGAGRANSTSRADTIVEAAKAAARALAGEHGESGTPTTNTTAVPASEKNMTPRLLLDACLAMAGTGEALVAKSNALHAATETEEQLKQELRAVRDDVAAAQNTVAQLRNEQRRAADELAAARVELEQVTRDLHQQQAETAAMQRENERVVQELAEAHEALAVAQGAAEKVGEGLQRTAEEAAEAKQQLGTVLAQLQQTEVELAEVKENLADRARRAADLGAVLDSVAALLLHPRGPEEVAVLAEGPTIGADAVVTLQALDRVASEVQAALAGAPVSILENHGAVAAGGEGGSNATLPDLISALCAWKEELLADMQVAVAINETSEALAAFLRDVVRDVIPRLVQLREGCGEDDPMLSTRVSLALDPEEPPRPLVHGDPSQYVEYILGLEGISEEAKRAVQDHMTSSAVIGSGGGSNGDDSYTPGSMGPVPSTWDVIADLHENLAVLADVSGRQADVLVEQREANEVLRRANGALHESLEAAQNALRNWADSAVEARDHTQPPSPDGSQSGADRSLFSYLHDDIGAVVDALRRLKDVADEEGLSLAGDMASLHLGGDTPVDGAAASGGYQTIRDLPSLVEAVAAMRGRLVELRGTAEDGIAALSGATGFRAPRGGGRGGADDGATDEKAMGDPRTVKERLLDICRETGVSLQGVKQILGIAETPGEPLPLHKVLPNIQAKIQELDQARKDSEAFVQGLDSALNDELASSTTSSNFSGRSSKSLKAKKKPLPALQGNVSELMAMTHKQVSTHYASAPTNVWAANMSPESRIAALRARALGKIDEVQDLRMACRAAINILEGSYVEGQKPPAYGDVLVPLLLSQIEDVKKCLPQCDDALSHGTRGSTFAARKNGSVGAKMAALSALVQSLQMERNSLQDQLAGKARQNMILLEDLERQAEERLHLAQAAGEEAARVRQDNAALRARQATLDNDLQAAKSACEELEEEASRLGAAADDLAQKLARETAENDALAEHVARRQHENNVLANALASALVQLGLRLPSSDRRDTSRTSPGKGREVTRDADDVVPLTTSEMELLLRQQLARGDGEPLTDFVQAKVVAIRDHWRVALEGSRGDLAELRGAMQALRDALSGCWDLELRPLAEELLAGAEEEAAVLRVENDMLRPRAQEREQLAKELRALRKQLANTEADLAAAQADADAVANEASALRRALREAEVDQVICAIPGGSEDRRKAHSAGIRQQPHPSVNAAELERRMIRGAAALTMEAIDAMAGENMAHMFGDMAARTVQLYRAVDVCVAGVLGALYGYKQGHNAHALAASIENSTVALNQLADTADELWSTVPALFKVPYLDRK